MRKSILSIFIILILAGCSSSPRPDVVALQPTQPAAVPAQNAAPATTVPIETSAATPTTVPPTPTAVPTPAFPLSIQDPLPVLAPVSPENASQLIPVAGVNTESISDVFLTENQDKILISTTFGVQPIDRATFNLESYQPQSGLIFGRAFSPDGARMAQLIPGSPKLFDLSLEVTDVQSGKTTCTYQTVSPSNTNTLTFHADGGISYLASGNDSHLWRWDGRNCKLTLELQPRWPLLALSQDGSQAAEGNESALLIYSTGSGVRKSKIEISNLRGAYFLPGENSILVTTKSGNAIYDLANGEKIHDFPGNMGDYFASYHLSPDGRWLLINAYQVSRALRLSDASIFSVPDGSIQNGLVVTADNIWDIEKQAKVANLQKYNNGPIRKTVLLSADGKRAAVSLNGEPYFIDLLDLSTYKPLFTIADYHNPIALPDGSGFIATMRGKTAFFDYSSDQPSSVLDLHYAQGQALENGDLLVWDRQGNIHQLDPVHHTILHSARLPFLLSEVTSQNLSPAWAQGREYAFDDFVATFMTPRWSRWAVSHNRQLGIRVLPSGVSQLFKMRQNTQILDEVPADDVIATSAQGNVLEMTFSPDDRFAAGVYEQKIVIWDAATGQQVRIIPLTVQVGAIYDFDFSPDGNRLLLSHQKYSRDFSTSIHADATVWVFDISTGQQLRFFALKQTYRKAGCNIGMPFAVTADSAQIITITENCRLGIFDMGSWELQREFHEPFQDANIDLAISPDNRLLAVTYQDKLELWDLTAGTLIRNFLNPALHIYPANPNSALSYLYQVAFSPDGTLLGTRFSGHGGMDYNSVITLWGVP